MVKKVRISVIIPALNEEKNLPLILKDLRRQSFKEYEIIVGDAGSKDDTVKIARSFGCVVAKDGGRPAVSRNAAARRAKGEFLAFIDADARISKDLLENVYVEMVRRKLDCAACQLRFQNKELKYRVLAAGYNLFMNLAQYFDSNGSAASGIIIRSDLHRRIKGFKESLSFGEDSEYILRASKKGRFRTLRGSCVYNSARRFEKIGVFRLSLFYIKMTFLQLIGQKKKAYSVEYSFDMYSGMKGS